MVSEQPENMPLKVASASRVADDVTMIELRDPEGRELPPFTAGAHIAIHVPNGEVRKYSLCNAPDERDRYVIAVKREAEGRGGSISLVDNVAAGDTIMTAPPHNDFEMTGNPNSYLFIAGGIGITPILAMIRHLMATEGKPFKLYYFTRTPEITPFREELSGPQFRGKVVIHHDFGDPSKSFDLWPILDEPKGRHIYCCGPRGLMQAVRDMTGHWPSSTVHFEDFAAATKTVADNKPLVVRLAKSDLIVEVPPELSILEAVRGAGVRVPSSCESGTCGTCRTRLLAGEAEHRDLVLSDGERGSQIMICVSRAVTPELTLDL